MIEAQFEICRGRGNGMYTLRSFTGYDRDDNEIFSYVKTLARNPYKALEKAREYVKAEGHDPDGFFEGDTVKVLGSFDPETSAPLTNWGEADPEYQNNISKIENGIMPFGKYYDYPINEVPIDYLVWFFDGDIDKKQSSHIKEKIRLQIVECRRSKFVAYVEEINAKKAKAEAEREIKRNASRPVGQVGERIDITAKIGVIKSFDGTYGIAYFTILETTDGNVFKYVGSSCLGEKGDTVNLKATVKAHTEWEGISQTVINRPKFI